MGVTGPLEKRFVQLLKSMVFNSYLMLRTQKT